MRSHRLLAVALMSCVGASVQAQDDNYRHGRLTFVEPGVSLQRADDTGAEEASVNEPFLPGDRVWTASSGRVAFQFPDGSRVRLDRRGKLDYAQHEAGRAEVVVLRLWSGSLILRSGSRTATRFAVDTPTARVRAPGGTSVRVDAMNGDLRVSVLAGEATLDDGRSTLRLGAGEHAGIRPGKRADQAETLDSPEEDDFAAWEAGLEAESEARPASAEELPEELEPYAGELDGHGDWRYEEPVGRVWVPRVAVGWRPYSHGRWCWTPYGWTWVPYEPWGWAPFHYGRWGHSVALGWYWIPGRTWGPAWVSWAVGGSHVGWCALDRHDRAVVGWGRRGHNRRFTGRYALPRSRADIGDADAWNVVGESELKRRDLGKRRLAVERLDPAGLKVAGSIRLQPTRDLKAFRQAEAAPRLLSTRQTPGDFVPELAVDNKTTIPAPWLRRRGARGSDSGSAAAHDGGEGRGSDRSAYREGESGRSPASSGKASEHRGGGSRARSGGGSRSSSGGGSRSSGGSSGSSGKGGGSKSGSQAKGR